MSFAQWMKIVLIFGLINSSYGYQQRHNQIRRRVRDASFESPAQQITAKVLNDEAQIEKENREAIRKSEEIIVTITQTIMLAAKKIADVGTQDISSTTHWVTIQGEIRRGINVIIDAYRRYNTLHRQTCDDIESFTKDMISKYEYELSAINQLSVPSTTSGSIDTESPAYPDFMAKFLDMLKYGQFHQRTLPISLDCVQDMTTRALEQRAAVMNPVIRTYTVQLQQTPEVRTVDTGIPLSCGAVAEYNGCQTCPYSILNQARALLANACPNQCSF